MARMIALKEPIRTHGRSDLFGRPAFPKGESRLPSPHAIGRKSSLGSIPSVSASRLRIVMLMDTRVRSIEPT